MRHNLIEIEKSLSLEIREWFPQDKLLKAMSIVYPQYWDNSRGLKTVKDEFIEKCKIL